MNVSGAYGFTFIPFFNPMYRAFVEAGGVCAVPNIRGGGIYGQEWYDAGSGKNILGMSSYRCVGLLPASCRCYH